jgi:hypothetical protein
MRCGALACALALLLTAPAAGAAILTGSRLALPAVTFPEDGLLAQRTIDRQWGPSDDSTYVVVDVPGWKSEGGALAMSAILPGAGHLYVGERSGWAFLLIETAGWVEHHIAQHDADRRAAEARAFVGNPYDTSSTWSLARYHEAGNEDTQYLEALWAGDREAYYREIADNPAYLAGYAGIDPGGTKLSYLGLRDARDSKLKLADNMETLLWLNHLIAAFDAFRAAKIHNLPLRQDYQLRFGQRFRHGRPEFRAALVRRF